MNAGIYPVGYVSATMPTQLLGMPTPVPTPSSVLPLLPSLAVGLLAWWDAADESTVTLNGGNVSRLSDKSGNGLHLTQTTATNQPAYSRNAINGRNAMTWSTTNHRLTNSSITVAAPTVFSVFRVRAGYSPALAKGPIVWDTLPGGNRFVHYVRENSSTILDFGREDGIASKVASHNISFGTTVVTACVALPVGHWLFSGGVRRGAATAGANGFGGISVGNLRGLPNPGAPNYNFDGQICEIIVYSAALSDAQRLGVERYLAAKWGTAA
jgi:hypothetical protein